MLCNLSKLGLNEGNVTFSILLPGGGFSPNKERRTNLPLFAYFNNTDKLNVL